MPYLTRSIFSTSSRHLGELLLQDIASLLTTSRRVRRSLEKLRPQCGFSPCLTSTVDTLLATSRAGEALLEPPLADADVALPAVPDPGESKLLTDFFVRLPGRILPVALAADVTGNLRLLAQHIDLKARLAADEAWLAGQQTFSDALMGWATEWRNGSVALHRLTGELRGGNETITA